MNPAYIIYLSIYVVIIPVSLGIFKYKLLNPASKLLIYYLSLGFVFDFSSHIISQLYTNNLFLFAIWEMVELPFVLIIINTFFQKYYNQLPVKTILTAFYILLLAEYLFIGHEDTQITTYVAVLGRAQISCLAGFILVRKTFHSETLIYKAEGFWLLIGILLYFTISLMVFLLSKVLTTENLLTPYFIHTLANVMMYISFTIHYKMIKKTSDSVLPQTT